MSTQNYRRSKRNLDVNKNSNMSDDVISISSTEEPEEDVADSRYVKKVTIRLQKVLNQLK